jgi:hypothetical protein
MSNKEFRTAEVLESSKAIFFTSIFCGSLFCGSAVHILDVLIADNGIFDGPVLFPLDNRSGPLLAIKHS